MGTLVHEPDEVLLGFARALRASGVPVTLDRSRTWLEAAALVDLGDRQATYWAGRATLCGCPDDLTRYDQVFDAWFLAKEGLPRSRPRTEQTELVQAPLPQDEREGTAPDDDPDTLAAMASAAEVLRHRDIAELSGAQKAALSAMFAALHPHSPRRRAHRRTAWRRGEIDAHRTLRTTLRRMGEPGPVEWRRRGTRPRRVVLLVDVSGSMSKYADALLRLSHRFVVTAGGRGGVEVFTLGTRLTHVTRALRIRDPERALIAAGETVPDWAGGTRLGENLKAFLDRWGQRGMARGSVVVVFSDGWERGDPTLLADQMARLQRMAHRVVWVNPHRGKTGYQPVQGGVIAALPHVDDFLAGHSLATFAELVEVVAHA
jgi:uncharacterized protein with von Willebrand factor type A (vWA) domain